MTNEQFWEIVAAVGWGTKHTDYDKGNEILRGLLPDVDEMQEFRRHFDDAQSKLIVAIEEWEEKDYVEIGTGDDGFSDLTAHVVGLGQKVWEQNVADPQLAWDRAAASYGQLEGYRESFSYCIPYESDYLPQETKLRNEVKSIRFRIRDIEENINSRCACVCECVKSLQRQKLEQECRLVEAEGKLRALDTTVN